MSVQDALPAIAVVGMAGRFPGAAALDAFWDNLRRGVESITHFPPGELEDAYGRSVQNQPGYVRARSILEGVELFDAEFFNFLPREAGSAAAGSELRLSPRPVAARSQMARLTLRKMGSSGEYRIKS